MHGPLDVSCSIFSLVLLTLSTSSLLVEVCDGLPHPETTGVTKYNGRDKRLFSVFNIVSFPNLECTAASDSSMSGTCQTESECAANDGSADGLCASNFGVCCVYYITSCGGTIKRNTTYLQNSEYPSTTSASQTCSFTFDRVDTDLCQIRLDFDNLVTASPPSTGADLVGKCSSGGDYLTITSPSGQSPPTVCGTLTGQHMIFETGAGTSSSAGTAVLTFGSTAATRTYKIKVTYYSCSDTHRPPDGCVTYHTGVTNTVKSFNFNGGTVLQSQNFEHCIRQEEGFCQIMYSETPTTGTDSFDLYGTTADTPGTAGEITCNQIYVAFPSSSISSGTRCGIYLVVNDADTTAGTIVGDVTPFHISVFADATLGTGNIGGYSIDYTQVPCT